MMFDCTEAVEALARAIDRAILGRVHEFLKARPLRHRATFKIDQGIRPLYGLAIGHSRSILLEGTPPRLGDEHEIAGVRYTVISVNEKGVMYDRPLEKAVKAFEPIYFVGNVAGEKIIFLDREVYEFKVKPVKTVKGVFYEV